MPRASKARPAQGRFKTARHLLFGVIRGNRFSRDPGASPGAAGPFRLRAALVLLNLLKPLLVKLASQDQREKFAAEWETHDQETGEKWGAYFNVVFRRQPSDADGDAPVYAAH